jgi:Domain of unknown function (DUF222)/HNH endonuclease
MCEIEAMREADVSTVADRELLEQIQELEHVSRAIDAERARRIAEADRRRTYASDGYLSMSAWLRGHLGLSGRVACEHVRVARALESMPGTRAALGEGAISTSAVSLLVTARAADPVAYERSERLLVDLARRLAPRDLARAIEHWRALADTGSEEADRRRFERRGVYVSPTLDGMVRIDGELDPETGRSVLTALSSMQDVWMRSGMADARTPAKRRADALGEICRRYLDDPERASVAGERPHLVVTMDLDSLQGRGGDRCELDGTRVAPETARRLACDASVSRVITAGGSEPLELGRRTPVVPTGLRRAVVLRDGGCRFPGCDRSQGWCDAHHVVHWADGGQTNLSNLLLLCRPHHRAVHAGFGIGVAGETLVFRRPDGSVLRREPRARASPTAAA